MAQIKIEITYDPSKETLDQAIAGLVDKPMMPAPKKTETATAAETKTVKSETVAAVDPQADPEPQAEAKPQAGKSEPEKQEKPVTKTDVRAVATALSKSGKQAALKTIFAKFGAAKLSDVKESDYPALMKELVAANG